MRALAQIIDDWSIDLVTTNCAVNIHGALAARRAGLPHIWHIRERIGTDGSMHFRLGDQPLVRRIADLSTTIAAVSEFVAEPFRKYISDEKIEVVHDGVDVVAFEAAEARERSRKLRERWGIPEGVLLIGKVANVTAHAKRHDLFLRAAAEVAQKDDQVRFVVVGEVPQGSNWFCKPALDRWHGLESLAHSLGLDGRLVWADSVPDPPAIMSAIDILAHACDIEGFPRVVFEATAAGKPVVGPDAGGFVEAMGAAGGILVTPGSAGALADGILALLSDLKARRQIGLRGRERARVEFSMGIHMVTMERLYKKCNVAEPGWMGA